MTQRSSELSANEVPNSSQMHAMINEIKAHRHQEAEGQAAKRSSSPLTTNRSTANAPSLPPPSLPPARARDSVSPEERRGRSASVRSLQVSRKRNGPSWDRKNELSQVLEWTHLMSPTGPHGKRCPSETGSIRSAMSVASEKSLDVVSGWNETQAQADRAADRNSITSPRGSLERPRRGDAVAGQAPEWNPAAERVGDAWNLGATNISNICKTKDSRRWIEALHGPDCRVAIPEHHLPGHAYGEAAARDASQDRYPPGDAYRQSGGPSSRPPGHAYTAAKDLGYGQYSWVLERSALIIKHLTRRSLLCLCQRRAFSSSSYRMC